MTMLGVPDAIKVRPPTVSCMRPPVDEEEDPLTRVPTLRRKVIWAVVPPELNRAIVSEMVGVLKPPGCET